MVRNFKEKGMDGLRSKKDRPTKQSVMKKKQKYHSYNGDVVAWDLSLSLNLEQTKRMLDKVFKKYSYLEGLIFHGDMCCQYQPECKTFEQFKKSC